MFNTILEGDKWLDSSCMRFPSPVVLYSNRFQGRTDYEHLKVLLLSCEPRAFRPSNASVLENAKRFDLILTTDDELLTRLPHARLFPFGTSWIPDHDAEEVIAKGKKFGVSFLCGGKRVTKGHLQRQEIWHRQREIALPKTFWISSASPVPPVDNNPVLPKDGPYKHMMFEYQFHIVVENSQENGYFSEKLMDCIKTETVPVYLGCPNICEFLDTAGMVCVNDVPDVIEACRSITPETYAEKLPAVKANRERGKQYWRSLESRIEDAVWDYLFPGRPRE